LRPALAAALVPKGCGKKIIDKGVDIASFISRMYPVGVVLVKPGVAGEV